MTKIRRTNKDPQHTIQEKKIEQHGFHKNPVVNSAVSVG